MDAPRRGIWQVARLGALALALALGPAGCMLQPLPTREESVQQALPNLKVPGAWKAPGTVAGTVAADPWIAGFRDAGLEAYIAEVLAMSVVEADTIAD